MFLSMNWICDFVDLTGLDRKSLIKNFTLSTAEVEDIIVKGEDTFGVVVAEIVSIEDHPNSKKLHLLKVNNGKEILDVCDNFPVLLLLGHQEYDIIFSAHRIGGVCCYLLGEIYCSCDFCSILLQCFDVGFITVDEFNVATIFCYVRAKDCAQ